MKKIAACLLLLMLFPLLLCAQGETSNWFFGNNAGIRFNNDGTVSAVPKSSINTFEGCASISDAQGNLLFYTDGVTVYDRSHEIMQNGKGLYGDPSSTQSGIIVPFPESTNRFYIFTIDTSTFEGDPDYGLNYSIVDMTENSGLGAVTVKNVNLLKDCSEKISAVLRSCFDRSIWVTTLGSANGAEGLLDTFYAFEVSPQGLNLKPVISTLTNFGVEDPRGYMKFSANGLKMAVANSNDGLYLFDFDAQTGIVSNPAEIFISGVNKIPYGVEFSPNNRFLYVHSSEGIRPNSTNFSYLLQFDLEAPNISNSQVILDERNIFRGALQLGRNGKIYRTLSINYNIGTPYLGVIHNPNEPGLAAGYEHDAISLNGKMATQGLPPFIQSFFNSTPLVRNEDGTSSSTLTLCLGDSLVLEADQIPGATYFWEKDGEPLDFFSGNQLQINTTSQSDAGLYRVEILSPDPQECPVIGESLVKIIPKPDPVLSVTQCDVDLDNTTDGITTINLREVIENPDVSFSFYETLADRNADQAIANVTTYQNSEPFNQTLYYKATNVLGCVSLGEVEITVSPVNISQSSFGPLYACGNSDQLESTFDLQQIVDSYTNVSVQFYADLTDLSLQTNPLPLNYMSTSATIYARLQNQAGCQGVELIDLVVSPTPQPEMPPIYYLCSDGGEIPLYAPPGYDRYSWYKWEAGGTLLPLGSRAKIILQEIGRYQLVASYEYEASGKSFTCSKGVSFEVVATDKARIESVEVADFSTDNSVKINVVGEGQYQYSLDGITYQENNVFRGLEPGVYTIHVKDNLGCGITRKEIAVMGYPKFFTPNGDGINDYWQVTGIEGEIGVNSRIFIYDRYGNVVTQILPSEMGWNGRSNARDLPAADYWFSISLRDGRIFKGHFALKR